MTEDILLDDDELRRAADVLDISENTLRTINNNHPSMAAILQSSVAKCSVKFFEDLAVMTGQHSEHLGALILTMSTSMKEAITGTGTQMRMKL